MNEPKHVHYGLFLGALLVLTGIATAVPILPKAEATMTVISSNSVVSSITVNAGDTLLVQKGISLTVDNLVNNGNIINQGRINSIDATDKIDNYGIILNLQNATFIDDQGKITNHEGGIIKNDIGGSLEWHASVDNFGLIQQYGNMGDQNMVLTNYPKGIFNNYADIQNFGGHLTTKGGTINNWGSINGSFGDQISNDVNGTINNYGSMTVGGYFVNLSGTVNNNAGATLTVGHPTLGPAGLDNYGILNNAGTYYNTGHTRNFGSFNNNPGGQLLNYAGPIPNGKVIYRNYGVLSNAASATITNDSTMTKECGATFVNNGTFNGNPIVDNCATYPITHMSDTTATAGYGVHAPKPARAEYASATSQLVGDKIDSITLKLKKVGTISGTATIGILDSGNNVKKSFGTINVATLTTAYTDYEFHLTGGELYTIQSGDRIGIKYTGGDASNWVSVMLDLDPADPFDGTKSYAQYYQGGWLSNTDRDMYMVLKQTHA